MDSADKTPVAVVKCPDYRAENLARAVRRSLDLIGGLGPLLKPRARVFVKVNHLASYAPPERAIITHPDFVAAVLRLLLDYDVSIVVGDDIASSGEDGYSPTGYRRMCEALGVGLVNLKETGFAEVRLPGSVLKKTYIARPVLEADILVNLPKLKTHSFAIFTGAVKNMYGVIPHGLRINYHRRFMRNEVFSQMLVDLYARVKHHLTVMDAVVGLEGEGPSAGAPKSVGVILASRDGVAVDAVASSIVGYNPLQIFTLSEAEKRNIGAGDLSRIEIRGEDIALIRIQDFRHSAAAVRLFRWKLPAFLYAYIQAQLALIPEVKPNVCTACQECVGICPAAAVILAGRTARVDESKCLHCLCCHEVCPYQAIRLKRLPLGELILGARNIYKKVRALFAAKPS